MSWKGWTLISIFLVATIGLLTGLNSDKDLDSSLQERVEVVDLPSTTIPPTTTSTSTTSTTLELPPSSTSTSEAESSGVNEQSSSSSAPYTSLAPAEVEPATSDDDGGELASIRACEQGEAQYATDTGNGYYGAYQFAPETWASVGGSGNPADASPAEQDMRAQMMIDAGRRSEWPNC